MISPRSPASRVGDVRSALSRGFRGGAGRGRLRLARWVRSRPELYPTVVIVTASYYALFAVLAGDPRALVEEAPGFLLFATAATIGYRVTPWVVVTAFVGHGAFDVLHGEIIANPGTPPWWPAFCLSFDVTVAACLALRIRLAPLKAA